MCNTQKFLVITPTQRGWSTSKSLGFLHKIHLWKELFTNLHIQKRRILVVHGHWTLVNYREVNRINIIKFNFGFMCHADKKQPFRFYTYFLRFWNYVANYIPKVGSSLFAYRVGGANSVTPILFSVTEAQKTQTPERHWHPKDTDTKKTQTSERHRHPKDSDTLKTRIPEI